jgi:hypothetical protein
VGVRGGRGGGVCGVWVVWVVLGVWGEWGVWGVWGKCGGSVGVVWGVWGVWEVGGVCRGCGGCWRCGGVGVWGCGVTPYVRHSSDCTCCDFGHLRFTTKYYTIYYCIIFNRNVYFSLDIIFHIKARLCQNKSEIRHQLHPI